MAKKREQRPGYGRILDEWSPPPESGPPIGCLATTFTLDTAFFEEDCLGRFLQLETNAEDHGAAFLIEREEKLSAIKCAIIVDARNAHGRRSPRWDLLLARVPSGCQHAKVSILQWERHIRVIIGSANTTEAGHCENLEIFGVLNFYEGSSYPRSLGSNVIRFMRELLEFVTASSEAIDRAKVFLDGIFRALSKWNLPENFGPRDAVQVHLVTLRPGSAPILSQLKDLWPSGTMPHSATVTSPYFDAESPTNAPVEALWSLMRSRGETSVHYQAPSEFGGNNRYSVSAPKSLLFSKPARHSAITSIAGVPYLSSDGKGKSVRRFPHAKVIHLWDDRWSIAMLGSSNFTSKGLGLDRHCNIEVNLVYRINESHDRALAKAFNQSLPLGFTFGEDAEIIWAPIKDECEEDFESIPVLPACFQSATLMLTQDRQRIVRLVFAQPLPENWKICPDGIPDPIIDAKEWRKRGCPHTIDINWSKLAAPSGLEVHLPSERVPSWWLVNISDASALPPPEELRDLPLEVLLEILTSTAPMHRVLMRWRERQEQLQRNRFESTQDLNALSRVNVSSFLLQRTRRVSAALMALRRSLERPMASKESLVWRIAGPVGVDAVTKAIESEAQSPEETAFLLTELALELRRVRPCESPFGPSVDEVLAEIELVCERIRTKVESFNLSESSRIRTYTQIALRRPS